MDLHTEVIASSVAVVTCSGRLNMVAAPGLKSYLQRTIAEGQSRIVVDLTAVGFIDSSGLGALIGGLKMARQSGGDLRIAAPSTQVRTVLGLTNLDRVLRPHANVKDAVDGW